MTPFRSPAHVETDDSTLILYCKSTALLLMFFHAYILVRIVVADLFTTMNVGTNSLRDTLLAMAFHGSDLPSLSVYRCILALSSMRLYSSEDARARRHYSHAVSTLSSSIKTGSGTTENLQHIASSMLLSIYEVCDKNAVNRSTL
jgi:hypothetical protein